MTDLDLTPDEALLAATARQWLAEFADNTYLNRQETSEEGYELHRWREICNLGWASANLPEGTGGGGGTLTEAGLIARECGRACYASPLLSTMRGATALAGINDDKSFDETLSVVSQGRPVALIAPADRTLHAEPMNGGGYRIAGPPVVVEWLAAAAQVIFMVPIAHRNSMLAAVVSPDQVSGRLITIPSIDNERVSLAEIDGFVVPTGAPIRVAPRSQADRALARADLLRASLMVGGCESVLERTVDYAKHREQFGRPIGGFQAVRHHLARMMMATDAACLACNEALTHADAGTLEPAMAAVALFAAGRSYVDVVLTAAQIHGGIGTTVEHILHHHFRRAKAMQLRSGKRANRLREIHRGLIVEKGAGLW